ncbi:MAG: DHH family phosphoesterase, partial [Faecalibacterium sp.]|nr:DHH family phosphoesterase [Faecalibacterium sp.]
MKKLWKKFDTFLIELVAAIIFVAITAYFNLWVAACEFVCVAIIVSVKLYYTKTQKEKLLYQVGAVAEELDFEQGKAFSTLTVSCCVIDENGKVIWFNDSFKNSFEIDENMSKNNIRNILKREKIDKMLEGRGFRIKIDSRYFAVYSSEIGLENECVYLLYFFDETKLRLVEKEYYDTRPSIMLSVIDNADEIYQNFKESDCAAIFSRIEKMIDDWASSYGALCRKFSNARMLIFAEERGLQKMISDKFSILNDIRQLTYNDKPTEVTLSIGIGKEADLNDANNSAKQALDMAQSRGGDQVAIKHEAQYKFYGGVSEGFEKKNKVRTRLIAKTVAEIIKDSDNVLIMGHRFSDFDAIGSAIGMYCIAEHFSIPANIVVDRQTTLAGALVDKLCSKYGDDLVISPGSAASHVKENTLVIVVDTHKQDFTECPALIDKAGKVMVIDHHRKSVSFIEDTVVFSRMPSSS